jgi:hypothetical protein
MMSSYNRRVLESQFRSWLDESTYISKGHEYAPRKYVLYWFVEDLCDFVKSKGYVFRAQVKDMAQDWARSLFRAHKNLKSRSFEQNPDHTFDDYDWYSHRLDYITTEPFFKKWSDTDDFSLNHSSSMLLYCAFDFAWGYINIRASSETLKVDEMVENSESDEDGTIRHRVTRNPADPYLEDQANAASKYNRWD